MQYIIAYYCNSEFHVFMIINKYFISVLTGNKYIDILEQRQLAFSNLRELLII